MKRAARTLLRLTVFIALAACDGMPHSVRTPAGVPQNETTEPPATETPLNIVSLSEFHDFGDPNFRALIRKMRSLNEGTAPAGTVLRVVQFGDSHTASDTITSGLRQRLQRHFGNAGIGWVAPMKAPGQNHSLVSYESKGWKLTTSRQASSTGQKNFPMGGYIATPEKNHARLTVLLREESTALWRTRVSLKQWKAPLILADARGKRLMIGPSRPLGLWRDVTVRGTLRLPFTITAASEGDAELGGFWLEKNQVSGVTVSAIGLNGVILKNWEYWSAPHQWTQQLTASQADMVILAYGINEAIRPELDLAETQNFLRNALKTIRTALPGSVIVVVGAPDALVAADGADCDGRLLPRLREVKEIQHKAAKEAKTLFWDWQAAMGGPCSMELWANEGLAKEDNVHFTPSGYQKSAEIFYSDLMALMHQAPP